MLKPDFFIVGAPKSATTSLFSYLKQHPDVFLPKKELYYFCSDLTFLAPPLPEDIYLSYYTEAKGQKAVGEASVYYLVSMHAAASIKKLNPNARIIIMLREPVGMVYSLHSQLLANGDERIENFERALAAEEQRIEAGKVDYHHQGPLEALFYTHIAKYHDQVKRYLDVFGMDKVHIILFDDFIKNPEEEYKKVLKFLGVPEIMPGSFETVNPNKVTRNKAMLRFIIDPPMFVKALGRKILPHHSKRREIVMDALWSMNTKPENRKPIKKETKEKLRDIYSGDIEQLQLLIKRDLSNWLK
jgi:hypothetical protein